LPSAFYASYTLIHFKYNINCLFLLSYRLFLCHSGDWGHSFDGVIPEMLSAGVRVLIYAGNKDIICNELGNRRWVDAMEWKRSDQWAAANVTWTVDGEDAGTVTEVGPLAFLSVSDAGHMVPMDKPKQALELINKFTSGEPFVPQHSSGVAMKGEVGGVALAVGRKGGAFVAALEH